MPILRINLATDSCSDVQMRALLKEGSALYAEVLESPIERVRVFVNRLDPAAMAVGGEIIADTGMQAPFFEVIILAGRAQAQKQRLMAAVTDLLSRVLEIERGPIRGVCWEVPPDNWCIAGTPASIQRAQEIQARDAVS